MDTRATLKGIAVGLMGLTLVLIVGMGSPASAISCASGTVCTEDLVNNNIDNGAEIVVRVTVDNTGANTVITVAFVSSNLSNAPIGFDQFGYQASVDATSAGWNQANNCPCNMDGFGTFLSETDNPGGNQLSVTFTLASLVTVFPVNANGAEFATHFRFGGNCSGFVSDGTASGVTPNANCNVVPEPATLLLAGSGLVAAGLLGRARRWFKGPRA